MLSGMMADCDECGAIYSMKVGAFNGMICIECGGDLTPMDIPNSPDGIVDTKGIELQTQWDLEKTKEML